MRTDRDTPGIDGLSYADLHSEPAHVHCGACLDGDIPREEATLVEFRPGQFAYICRYCIGCYQEVVEHIKPLKFYSHAA